MATTGFDSGRLNLGVPTLDDFNDSAALEWIERHHAPARSVCVVQSDNAGSLRVAAKCGYNEFARTTYKNAPAILLERSMNRVCPGKPL